MTLRYFTSFSFNNFIIRRKFKMKKKQKKQKKNKRDLRNLWGTLCLIYGRLFKDKCYELGISKKNIRLLWNFKLNGIQGLLFWAIYAK